MKNFIRTAAIVLASAALFSPASCASALIGTGGAIYQNADKYTAGDREIDDKITSVNICWTSGTMNLSYHDGSSVSVKETSKVSLSDDKKVHTWVDGETLWVQFAKSGEKLLSSEAEKALDIELPKDVPLSVVNFSGASCDFVIDGIEADKMTASSSSGSGHLLGCSAKDIAADSSSGSIEIIQVGESDSIRADSSSGSVSITAETAKNVSADSSSGKITVDVAESDVISADTSSGGAGITAGKSGKITADSSSGNITVNVAEMPSEMKIDASSGDVTIFVPEGADFTAKVDTSSGSFDSDIALSKSGSSYVAGSGSSTVSVDTSSGDVNIKKA